MGGLGKRGVLQKVTKCVKGVLIGRNFCGALMLRLRYYGRKCKSGDLENITYRNRYYVSRDSRFLLKQRWMPTS